MVDALASADVASVGEMVSLLLDRGSREGLAGVVRHFGNLPEAQREAVLARAGDLEDVLRQVGRSGDAAGRGSMIQLVEHARIARYAHLLVSQLHAEDAQVIRAAGKALLALAVDVMNPAPGQATADGLPRAKRAQLLVTAVADACTFFHRHRRRDVLLAAAALVPTRDPRLLSTLGNRHVPSFGAMVELIRQADHPLICRAMLVLAGEKSLTAAVAEGLSKPLTTGNALEVLVHVQLIHEAPIRAVVAGLERAEKLVPSYGRLQGLAPEQLRHMPRWFATLQLPPDVKSKALGDAAALGDTATRLRSLRALMEIEDQAAYQLIGSMCFDSDQRIARRALQHLVGRKWTGLLGLMTRLVGSNHEPVQRLAEQQLAPIGFDRLWIQWPRLARPNRLAAGRALIKIDSLFHHRLAERLYDASPEARLRALAMVRDLHHESYFEQALLELAADADARVASSAVKALAGIAHSHSAVAALEQALKHEDDRVRANAIEALEQVERLSEVRDMLAEIATGRGNRSRATAIKAMLDLPMSQATDALAEMLLDRDQRHRISALWVVERTGLAKLVHRVADLAKGDLEPGVRKRALKVIRQLAAAQEGEPPRHRGPEEQTHRQGAKDAKVVLSAR